MTVTLQRANHFLLFCILITVALYYGRPILVPVIFASLLAMLMAPVCRKLDSFKIPRALSCLVCILILLIVIGGIIGVIASQVSNFASQLPQMEKKVDMLLENIQYFLQDTFNISREEQNTYADQQMKTMGESVGSYFGVVVGGLFGTIASVAMVMIMTFLMLFNKEMYETFFVKLYKQDNITEMKQMLSDITLVSQQYLTGRAISMSWQMAAFSIGLLIIGIDNAILLGIIAGLLSIIPYIGPYAGGIFPVLMSLVTEDSLQSTAWVIVLLVIVQFIDNTFVEPTVVGGKVKLSALATVVILLIGGMLWGVVGMILFIPMLGIAKIVFDHVPELKPYAYLVGDPAENEPSKAMEWFEKHFKRFRKQKDKS